MKRRIDSACDLIYLSNRKRKVIYKNTSAKISNILYTTLKKKRKFNIYNFITKEIGDTFDNIFNLALKDWIKQ
jgi:hypothetical protein